MFQAWRSSRWAANSPPLIHRAGPAEGNVKLGHCWISVRRKRQNKMWRESQGPAAWRTCCSLGAERQEAVWHRASPAGSPVYPHHTQSFSHYADLRSVWETRVPGVWLTCQKPSLINVRVRIWTQIFLNPTDRLLLLEMGECFQMEGFTSAHTVDNLSPLPSLGARQAALATSLSSAPIFYFF